jgi:hypothetical protein
LKKLKTSWKPRGKMSYKIIPTIKQKNTFKKVINESKSASRAMRESGYDETTAKNPSNLTNSKGWQQLMDEYLDDEVMTARLNQIMLGGANRESLTALDMGYKLKNKYPKETTEIEQGEVKITIKRQE